MMKKSRRTVKGQFTLFVGLGVAVLLVIGVLFFLYFSGNSSIASVIGTTDIGLDELEAEDTAKECITFYAEEGLKLVEAQGGFIELDRNYLTVNDKDIGFLELSLDEVSEDLADYIEEGALENCFLSDSTYDLDRPDEISLDLEFEDEELNIGVDWPIKFSDNGVAFSLDEFNVNIDTKFKQLYEMADEEYYIDYGYQYEVSDVYVTVFEEDDGRIVYLNLDEEYFLFAVED